MTTDTDNNDNNAPKAPAPALIVSNYGSGIAMGILGDKTFQDLQYTRFLNYGAVMGTFKPNGLTPTSELKETGTAIVGKLHSVGEFFSYFITTKEAVVAAIAAQIHVEAQMDGLFVGEENSGDWNTLDALAYQAAIEQYDTFQKEEFMSRMPSAVSNDFFTVDTLGENKE